MTYDDRLRPHMIRPTDPDGLVVADGTYIVEVVAGKVVGFTNSSPVILLPPGSDASDVPAGTPIKAIIMTES